MKNIYVKHFLYGDNMLITIAPYFLWARNQMSWRSL